MKTTTRRAIRVRVHETCDSLARPHSLKRWRDALLLAVNPGKTLAAGTLWDGGIVPLRDYVTAFAAEYDTPFCLGRVLTAEPAPAELDMGMVANGLTELGRLVRDVAEGLRESGRQAQADQLARDFTESARVIAAGMERVGQDPEVERVRAVVGNSGGGQVMKTGDARHPMLAPSTRTGDFSKPINNAEQNQRNADFWKDQGRSSGDRTRDANAAKLKAQSQRR